MDNLDSIQDFNGIYKIDNAKIMIPGLDHGILVQ